MRYGSASSLGSELHDLLARFREGKDEGLGGRFFHHVYLAVAASVDIELRRGFNKEVVPNQGDFFGHVARFSDSSCGHYHGRSRMQPTKCVTGRIV